MILFNFLLRAVFLGAILPAPSTSNYYYESSDYGGGDQTLQDYPEFALSGEDDNGNDYVPEKSRTRLSPLENDDNPKGPKARISHPCANPPRVVTPKDVRFFYYGDPKNVGNTIEIRAADVANNSQVDITPDKQLIVVTHGFTQNKGCEISQDIKDAWLTTNPTPAVVLVDYGGIACTGKNVITQWEICYSEASCSLCDVARQIVDLLEALKSAGRIHETKVHLIGFSLGVPISGCTGKIFKERFGTSIELITGLDPAGNIFDNCNPQPCRYRSLTPSDARVVVAIHSNGGFFGTVNRMGHYDFWPNGGVGIQPGCILSFRPGCSHFAAAAFYLKTIQNPKSYYGQKCPSYNHYKQQNSCSSKMLYMGPLMDTTAEMGNYYFSAKVPNSHSGMYDRC